MLSPRLSLPLRSQRRRLTCQMLQYAARGDPNKKVKLVSEELADEPGQGEVLLQWLAAPLNPADVNMIQGTYPLKPPLPAVGGNEGVAQVLKAGDGVSLSPGTVVIPASAELGTWRTHSLAKAEMVLPLDDVRGVSLAQAATLLVNPPTAYRMLKDFQDLREGDTVLQNGANSAVGKAVIQIAKELGLRTVNVIRGDREDWDAVKAELLDLGADHVCTDTALKDHFQGKAPKSPLKKLASPPRLGLNCVAGKSVVFLATALADRGTLVTYGGMSRLPNSLPVGAFIFKDLEARGFWMSRWYRGALEGPEEDREKRAEERDAMIARLLGWMRQGKLTAPAHDLVPLERWSEAMAVVTRGTGRKQILQLSDATSLQ